jgi:hypothetical protein
VSRAIDDAVWALRQHVARRQVVEEEYRTAATRIAVAVPGSVVDALESMREATEPARGNIPRLFAEASCTTPRSSPTRQCARRELSPLRGTRLALSRVDSAFRRRR